MSSLIHYATGRRKTSSARVYLSKGKGKILVNNVPSYNLIISPSQIDDLNGLLDQIQPIVSLSDEDIEYVNKNYQSRAKLNRELIIKRNLFYIHELIFSKMI